MPPDIDLDTPPRHPTAQHRTEEHRHRPGILRVALQRDHEPVTVDDPGRRRQQRAAAPQVGLQRHRLGGAQHPHALDPVGLRPLLDARQHRVFPRIGRHDQLAAVAKRHSLLGAELIQRPPPGDAEPGHQTARRIVDPGMDHLAVARRGLAADALGRLQDDDLTPRHRQRPSHRQAHHPGTHHDAIDFLHPCLLYAAATIHPRLGWRRGGVQKDRPATPGPAWPPPHPTRPGFPPAEVAPPAPSVPASPRR